MFVGLAKLQPHTSKQIAIELMADIDGSGPDEEDDILAILMLM
jgi:hypothetical protein